MVIEKEDLEAIGEAIENLGQMTENNLQHLSLSLDEVKKFWQNWEGWQKSFIEEFFDLKKETAEIRELLENLDLKVSQLEARILNRLKEEGE
jgi:hypothetical protein